MSGRFITQVKLENFQDHKDSTIELTNGINLIVGSSDAGKSAVLRAINFVFHNNLKGDSFIRHGCNECRVTISFSDGVEVTRIKGTDVNSYHLKDSNGDNHSFPKVGTSVPEEIKKQLGQPPLDDKKKPISYADQMANLFLVDLSPTDLPRTLSELTGIQNLQTAAELLSKNARSFDRVIKEKNETIDKLKIKLGDYEFVDKDLESIEGIETKLVDINNKIDKTNKARGFVGSYNKIVQEAKSLHKKINLDSKFFLLVDKFQLLEKLNQNVLSSKQFLKNFKMFATEHNSLKLKIGQLKKFRCEENLNKLEAINEFSAKNTTASDYLKSMKTIQIENEQLLTNIDSEKTIIKNNQKQLNKLITKLKAEGNWCNTCNRPLI
jgi:chromosome segregation ATPase